jgi:hypothetical protein
MPRIIALAGAFPLLLVIAACGLAPSAPAGEGAPDRAASRPDPSRPAPIAPPGSVQAPTSPQELAALVARSYGAVRTLTADYETRQQNRADRNFARAKLVFARPRNVRMEFLDTDNFLLQGVTFVWRGGPNLVGKRMIGFFPVVAERGVREDRDLRDWTYDQTDFDAMVRSVLRGLPGGRLLGTGRMGGRELVFAEFPAARAGVATERAGIDVQRGLPVVWEFKERPQDAVVYTARYTNLALNSKLAPDAFKL